MKRIALLSVLLMAVACSVNVSEEMEFSEGYILPSVITVDMDEAGTKATYDFTTGRMRMRWAEGDAIFASPTARSSEGSIYRVLKGGGATNTFVADRAITYSSKQHSFYYPGDKIKNDPQFMQFSYAGQVQKKSDPTGHIAQYHSIRQYVEEPLSNNDFDPARISLAGCYQSGCIRFFLSGVEFDQPEGIELELFSSTGSPQKLFYDKNYMKLAYSDKSTGETIVWPSKVSTISLGLDGYGKESQLVAYMMHGCQDVILEENSILRVTVHGRSSYYADVKIPSATAIKGGYCSSLTVTEGWKKICDWDGEVVTLQEYGDRGVDVVIMGDGFIEEDFLDGTYDKLMLQIYGYLFTEEPYATLKDKFNVYYVKAVSPERMNAVNTGSNGARNGDAVTKFSVKFTENSTNMKGDNALVRAWAKKAFKTDADRRIKDATVLVVANHKTHAGTCSSSYSTNPYDYGQTSSIAYFAIGRNDTETYKVIHHEGNGHGIGKLGDEYYGKTSYSFDESMWTSLKTSHDRGTSRNVDKYISSTFNTKFPDFAGELTKDSDVYWSDLFGTRNHYEDANVESLGVFEGGKTYSWGFCRPTYSSSQSIMMSNAGIFNAIGRRQILYRVRYLTGEITSNCWGTREELEYFLEWDAKYVLNKGYVSIIPSSLRADNYQEEMLLPYAPEEFEEGDWVDGEFIPKATSGKLF